MKKLYHLRRERKERWDDARAGGGGSCHSGVMM